MPAASLLALLDDIATILDDVAVLTKKAAVKTSGVLGDDLALNAQQVSGVVANRELPIVWAVAKGSFVNKLILVPLALIISSLAPWAITPLLIVGGLFLCFEGCEKLAHHAFHRHQNATEPEPSASNTPTLPETESSRIKGAVRTDFVLSAEIIAITLGIVAGQDLIRQATVLSAIALIMTVGVYGLVAAIVKLDDAGLYLARSKNKTAQACGNAILRAAPFLMKTLSIAGTAAMFLVGGGIIAHGIPPLHHFIEHLAESVQRIGPLASLIAKILPSLCDGLVGIIAGTVVLAVVTVIKNTIRKPAHH